MPPPLVILGNPENRRVEFTLRAAASLGWPAVEVVAWRDFLARPDALREALAQNTEKGWLRVESPGENFEVERALLRLGGEWMIREDGPACLSAEELDAIPFRRGQILSTNQWFCGWCEALATVQQCLLEAGWRALNSPLDIMAMFDKARCHRLFAAAGNVPVPPLLGQPASWEHLAETLLAGRGGRVFLKPCHSSSASGVVALEIGRRGVQAFSSVEVVRGENGRCDLFNSLRVRRYRGAREVAELVDAICRHRCIVERWFPKAGHDGQSFDLRVLVIGGRAAHVVMRQSAGPITNLHLGNRRGDLAGLRQKMGQSNWRRAMDVAERAGAVFARSVYVAVDLLVAPGFGRFAVAEVNAFGDLLPGLLHEGRDTYTAELVYLLEGAQG